MSILSVLIFVLAIVGFCINLVVLLLVDAKYSLVLCFDLFVDVFLMLSVLAGVYV